MDITNGKKYYERHKKEILRGFYSLYCLNLLDKALTENNKQYEAMRTMLNAAQKDFECFKKKVEFETALDYASK